MAGDPGLLDEVRAGAPSLGARGAIVAAAERHALALAALPDPDLAARAADVRAVGRRAVRALENITAALTATGADADDGTDQLVRAAGRDDDRDGVHRSAEPTTGRADSV